MTAMTNQELFDDFQVIRVLGEGSFGRVFLIRHQITHAEYALKRYSKYQIFKLGKQKSLIRSTRILRALQHHNIINFYNYVIGGDDQIFLIYEACTKGSLEDIKGKIDIFCIKIIKQIMYQLAKSLQYLKSVAVAHRDIKPSNITFNGLCELKLIDFDEAVCYNEEMLSKEVGLAKQLSFETQTKKLYSRRSRAQSYVGTEMYMSPEMRNKTTTDERGDIWAFGCIFYELLFGDSLILDVQQYDDMNLKIQQTIISLQDKVYSLCDKTYQFERAFDLIRKVLKPNPIDRLPISEILQHQFFANYQKQRSEGVRRLRKLLRSNCNLSHPRILEQALSSDLIGMRAGSEKFQFLKNIPIFLTVKHLQKEKSFLRKLCSLQWLKQIFLVENQLQHPRVFNILGGPKYFKLKNPSNQEDKIYIQYFSIDSISIVEDKILIKSSITEEVKGQNIFGFWLEHITRDPIQLGKLFDLLSTILQD